MIARGFTQPLSAPELRELESRAHASRGHVLTATTLANSGHPGGSFSSMELYTVLYGCARIDPSDPRSPDRDRIVVSHGHTSPGVYAALAAAGFFPAEEFAAHFRQAGSIFEGHVERSVPGVEWSSGNLGQGLSAGVGMALAARMRHATWRTYVAMSDGEQHKGQVAEARRLAAKEKLADLTVLVDLNGIQISGHTRDIMPVNVAEDFVADGWNVIEVDGHDISAIYEAVRASHQYDGGPSAIIAHTVMGKPVSFMEDQADFHGRGLTAEEYVEAMAELDLDPRELDEARARRAQPCAVKPLAHQTPSLDVAHGTPRTYAADEMTDNRSAWGAALVDLAEANPALTDRGARLRSGDVGQDRGLREGAARRVHRVRGGGAQRRRRRRCPVHLRGARVLGRLRRVRTRRGVQPAATERHQRRRGEARAHALRARCGRGRQDAPVHRLRRRVQAVLRLARDSAGRPQPDGSRGPRGRVDAGQRRGRDGPKQAASVDEHRRRHRCSATATSSATGRSSGRAAGRTPAC